MNKRIVLDLTKCEGCEECTVDCGYFYGQHRGDRNQGIQSLKERATLAIVCRRCEHASCVAACPCQALQRQPDGVIKRYNLRCVSCKLCAHACPFGTIYTDMVPFYVTPCNYCLGSGEAEPPCARSCGRGALVYREVDPGEPRLHVLDDHLAVRSAKWVKREESP